MVAVTTGGLRDDGSEASSLPDVPWAIAAGTADVITADYDGAVLGLTDGLIVGFRATAANATATPTFCPVTDASLAASVIVREGGDPLKTSDIAGAGAEYLVRYNLSNNRWELLNPSRDSGNGHIQWGIATGTDAVEVTYDPPVIALTNGITLGFRAANASTSTTPTFSPNGLMAKTIVKGNQIALAAGDIAGAGAEYLVRYNATADTWVLLNPKYPASAADTASYAFSGNGELFKVLAADDTGGTNGSSAQPWFPTAGAVTVEAKTYAFEGFIHTTRAAGSSSHTTGVLFGGTSTVSSIRYQAQCKTGDANDLQAINGFTGAAVTELVVKAASTSTTENTMIWVRGVVRFSGAGTFIPQFKYSATPGGAPTIKANSFFRMTVMGAADVTAKGTWA